MFVALQGDNGAALGWIPAAQVVALAGVFLSAPLWLSTATGAQ